MKRILVVALLCLCSPALMGQNASPIPVPKIQFWVPGTGQPLAGGFVYTYAAGTTSPLATFTDSSGNVANPDPVPLDSNGSANIWLLGNECYKIVVQTSAAVQVQSTDNICAPINGGSINLALSSPPPIGTTTPNVIWGTDIVSKTTPAIDIRTYNATCNGTASDVTAIQSAINAAQTVASGNTNATVTGPNGKTCIIDSDINVSVSGIANISIGGNSGPFTSAGAGMIWVLKNGAKININPSVVGNGQGVTFHHMTLMCNADYSSTDTCTTMFKIGDASQVGSTFGPLLFDHVTINGHHNSTSGAGSYGAASALTCASHCALQVDLGTYSNLENFSGPIIDISNSTNSGGTNIRAGYRSQLFDAPVGIRICSSGPAEIAGTYLELLTHAIEIDNACSWTLGQYHIHDTEAALNKIPPFNNQTDTGVQRFLYITNQRGPTATMTAMIDMHDNKVNLSEGYVTGAQGLAPYAVETNLACGAFCYSVFLNSHDNYYAGITTSAILANIGFGSVTSYHDLVTTDLAAYEPASNLPAITGTYIGAQGFYDPSGFSIAQYQSAVSTSFSPIFQACVLDPTYRLCASASSYFQLQKPADGTHFAGWTMYDNAATMACGFGGDTISGGILTQSCANTYRQQFGNVKTIGIRNTANSADIPLTVNGSDQLTFNGVVLGAGTGVASLGFKNGGSAFGTMTSAGSMNFVGCTVSGADPNFTITCTAAAAGSDKQMQYNNSASLGGDADFTYNNSTHVHALGASGILDLHSAATSAFLMPGGLSTGLVKVTTSTGASGSVAGSQSQSVGYGASGVPASYYGPVYPAALYGVVAGAGDQCGANLNALVAAVNSTGGTILFDIGTTLLSTCNFAGSQKLAPNVFLAGRGAAQTDVYGGTPTAPPAILKMTHGTDAAHIEFLTRGGQAGAYNLTVQDDTTALPFFLFTGAIPFIQNVTCWGSVDRHAGSAPVNDCIWLGNGTNTSCTGAEANGFCDYGTSQISVYAHNTKRAIVFGSNANGVTAFARGDYSDANVDGSLLPTGGFVEFNGQSGTPAYSNIVTIQAEMGPFGGGACNYKGAFRMIDYALANIVTFDASDMGTCDYGGRIETTNSTGNSITSQTGVGAVGCVFDPSTTFGNEIDCMTYHSHVDRTWQGVSAGLPGTASSGFNFFDLNGSGVLEWNGFGGVSYVVDTGLSRDGAGVLAIGNGSAGSKTGTLEVTKTKLTPVAFSGLDGSPTAGEEQFCSDCQLTSISCSTSSPSLCVCKAGGSGAYARYFNYLSAGANWYCQ